MRSHAFWGAIAMVTVFAGALPARGDAPLVLDLDGCISRALEANRELEIRSEEEAKAGYQVREAWSGAFPQLRLDGTINKNFERSSFYFAGIPGLDGSAGWIEAGSEYDFNATLGLRQPLWLGGRVGAAVKAARIFENATDDESEAVERDVLFRTRTLYYSAIFAREEIAVYQAARERAERHRAIAELRRDRGLSSDFELLRAETELAAAEAPLIAARNLYDSARLRLKVILGISADRPLEVGGDLVYVEIPPEALARRAKIAAENRPDRAALLRHVELLGQNVRVGSSRRWPEIHLLGAVTWLGNSEDLDFVDDERARSASASLEVAYPFWTSGGTSARVEQARADERIARLRLELLDEEISRDVGSAQLQVLSSSEIVGAMEKSLDLAARAYEIAVTRHESGLMSQMELLDAGDVLTEAKVEYLRAVHDALVAQAGWEMTVGIPWGEAW